jgi:hypothetical protein
MRLVSPGEARLTAEALTSHFGIGVKPRPPYQPYLGLTTPEMMRAFCGTVGATEETVRSGSLDRLVWGWLNPEGETWTEGIDHEDGCYR